MDLDTKLDIKKLVKSKNIAEMLTEQECAKIANLVIEEWGIDKSSRYEWEDKTSEAMKLALQVMEEKTFPWPGAANVKFPLITIAALQYQARAYPALLPSTNIVKARVTSMGDDNSLAQARASRIENYMSFQVLEEDEGWEENMDKALISQAIVGCAFKKSYFDANLQHNVSEHILAKDLYIPYFAKSLEKASRITQILYFSKNELLSKYRDGVYLECKLPELQPEVTTDSPLVDVQEESQGLTVPSNDPSAPNELLEQHRYLDLDGDGYEEPYIVTVKKDTAELLRIVARYTSSSIVENKKGEITFIHPDQYYTKFPFIPSPDGGIYDLGFGVLLGPLNESINTIFNQLIDAGTLSVTAGGFLGRGVKFRSGDNSFKPFEWKRVDSTGDDLQKGIFPLPVREPSMVLFQLLGLLIDYGNRIGMATDPLVGENPGQNTPAETSRNMLQEGQRIFSAVYKRTYRGLKEEFRKLYKLNSIYLNPTTSYYSLITGQEGKVLQTDFSGQGKDVVPAADPNMVSDDQKVQQAQLLMARADSSPLYNKEAVERNFLKAIKIVDIDTYLIDQSKLPPPPPDPKIVVETMKVQHQDLKLKIDMQFKMFDLMQEIEYLRASIVEQESRAALNYAQAEGIATGHNIAAMQTAVAAMKQKQDGLIKALEVLRDMSGMGLEKSVKGIMNVNTGNVGGVENPPNDSGVVQVPQGA
jgi:chaperonin GroES